LGIVWPIKACRLIWAEFRSASSSGWDWDVDPESNSASASWSFGSGMVSDSAIRMWKLRLQRWPEAYFSSR